MIVLIPAYEPDGRFVELARALPGHADELGVVIVDDGSGDGYQVTSVSRSSIHLRSAIAPATGEGGEGRRRRAVDDGHQSSAGGVDLG
jgi:hypothetical protein